MTGLPAVVDDPDAVDNGPPIPAVQEWSVYCAQRCWPCVVVWAGGRRSRVEMRAKTRYSQGFSDLLRRQIGRYCVNVQQRGIHISRSLIRLYGVDAKDAEQVARRLFYIGMEEPHG